MDEELSSTMRDRLSVDPGKMEEQDEAKSTSGRSRSERKAESYYEANKFKDTGEYIPADFSSFLLSLATSALIHLGEEADPGTGKKTVELSNARQAIDLVSMLEEKTQGNLTREEENLVRRLLYTLRMKYVALEKRHHA